MGNLPGQIILVIKIKSILALIIRDHISNKNGHFGSNWTSHATYTYLLLHFIGHVALVHISTRLLQDKFIKDFQKVAFFLNSVY